MTRRTNLAALTVLLQFLALFLARNVCAGCGGFDTTAVNKLPHDSSGDEYGADFYLADGNYIVVDDMESYNDSNNYIWDTWLDGCAHPNRVEGPLWACIELAIDPCRPVHGGAQSMEYAYDNREHWDRCPDYSEIRRQYDPPLNWTTHGEKALVLWFRGSAGNGSTPMWVALNYGPPPMATYGDNGEDPEDITKDEWLEWNINLSDFADGGIDLANVSSIRIGFGDGLDGDPDGTTGIVYFDDIRLYPARCVERFAPAADFTGDCATDWQDLETIAQEWLYAGGSAAQGNIAEYDATNSATTMVYTAGECNEYQASWPSPADGAKGVPSRETDVVLCWTPACGIGTLGRHYLFFSTDKDCVDNAPTYYIGWTPPACYVSPWLFANETCKNMGNEPLWTTFYWRVDEKLQTGEMVKGNTWSFTTGCDPIPAADANLDCLVNFVDFTTLAGSWLEQAPLWPPE